MIRQFAIQTIAWPIGTSLALFAAPTILAALAVITTGCLHENTPTLLRGEVSHVDAVYFVRECTTHRRYELKLNAHAEVLLERNIAKVREASPGPVLVELGGKALPATTSTPADALFDVRSQYAVREGSCE